MKNIDFKLMVDLALAAMKDITDGILTVQLPTDSEDKDVARFLVAFNEMVNIIRHTYEELEELYAHAENDRLYKIELADLILEAMRELAKDNLTVFLPTKGVINENLKLFRGYNNAIAELRELRDKRRAIEVKMVSSAKLASLGELATGVAHEINQPLTFINSTVQFLQMDLKNNELDEEQMAKDLKMVREQIDRIMVITNHMRYFGRADTSMTNEPFQMPEVFSNALILMRRQLHLSGIELKTDFSEHLPDVFGSKNKLEQVAINLFQNSIDALTDDDYVPEVGKRTIEIKMCRSSDGNFLEVDFSNNGPAMDVSVATRIFEPFFTTKEVGKGTGLGLSICYGIVQEHGGSIECQSEVGKGVTFKIRLPDK